MSLIGVHNILQAAQETVTDGLKTIEVDHGNVHSGDGYSIVPTTDTALAVNTTQRHFIVIQQPEDCTEVVHWKENLIMTDLYDLKVELWEDVYTPAVYSGTITISGATCELNAGDFEIEVDSSSVAITVTTEQSLADIISTAATAIDTGITGCTATFASAIITVTRSSDRNYVPITITQTASCTGVDGAIATAASTDELLEFTIINRNRRSSATSPLIIGVTSSSVTTELWGTNTQIIERFWIHGSSCYGTGLNVSGAKGGTINMSMEFMLKSTTNYALALINDGTSGFVVPWFYWYEEAS